MRVAKNVFKHVVKLRNVVEFHLQNSNQFKWNLKISMLANGILLEWTVRGGCEHCFLFNSKFQRTEKSEKLEERWKLTNRTTTPPCLASTGCRTLYSVPKSWLLLNLLALTRTVLHITCLLAVLHARSIIAGLRVWFILCTKYKHPHFLHPNTYWVTQPGS